MNRPPPASDILPSAADLRGCGEPPTLSPGTVPTALGLALALLVLYALTLSRHFSSDSMAFARLTTQGDLANPLFFQAEHLLYPFVGWLWYQGWLALGFPPGALVPLQLLNALFASLGVALFFLAWRALAPALPGSRASGLGAALALASSYGYWYHATEAEDQIIADVLLLAAFLLLALGWRWGARVGIVGLFGGLTLGLAVLLHGTAVLFLPAALLVVWWLGRSWRDLLMLLAPLVGTLGAAYLSVGLVVHAFRTPAEFWNWALAAPAAGVWGGGGLGNLGQAGKTAVKVALYLQEGPNFKELLGGPLRPENLLVALLFLSVWVLVVGSLVAAVREANGSRRFPLVGFALVWMGTYAAFNTYWAPEDIQFWIALVPPALLLVLRAYHALLRRVPRVAPVLAGVALAGFWGVNATTGVLPRSDLRTNQGYAQALCTARHTRSQDLIIAPGWDWAGNYLPYFTGRQVFSILDVYLIASRRHREQFFALLQERLQETARQGGKVYVVRLYDLPPAEKGQLRRVAGLGPEDFPFKVSPAGRCGGETLWEVSLRDYAFPYVFSPLGELPTRGLRWL